MGITKKSECTVTGNLINCWWECKTVQSLETIWQFPKLNINLQSNPTILLLGIYPTQIKTYCSHNKTCKLVLLTALFEIHIAQTHITVWMNLKNIKQKKPDTKTTYCMIPCMWHDRQIYRDSKQIKNCLELERNRRGNDFKWEGTGVTEILKNQTGGVFVQLCKFTKNCLIVYIKGVNFMVCKNYASIKQLKNQLTW